ncbi:MAG TPA: pilus assembly protein PilM [Minicystis sp.]|nr:pilus assembly protein PilM [Minicystis sp.]
MSRLLGIDASKDAVRVALVRTSYRRVAIEALAEVDVASVGSELEAVRALAGPLKPEATAVVLSGEKTFFRKLELPAAAQKEIDNVLAYELEATVPFEMDEAVFDFRVLKRSAGQAAATLPIFAAVARVEDVRERVALAREAVGVEPERVGAGATPLANLVTLYPDLERASVAGPIALANLGEDTSDVLVLQGGEAVFTRTVSRGTAGLPATAPAMARELRQTFAAWRTQGGAPLAGMVLLGPGAALPGAELYLTTELGVPSIPLTTPKVEQTPADVAARAPRFARALGLALGLHKSRGFNLRQGKLEPERRYPFLREKVPLLSGLAAVIAVSFGFSIIAELRTLSAEHELLTAKLAVASRDVLGTETTDPDKAKELLEGPGKDEDDPMPHADAFDAMVQVSKAVPKDVVHDIVEFEFQRQHLLLQGTVPSVGDAETIAKNLREYKCARDVKIGRTVQSGENKQKYTLDVDFKCTEPKKKGPPDAAGAASAAASPARPEAAKDGGK